jgi:hypothetical protein
MYAPAPANTWTSQVEAAAEHVLAEQARALGLGDRLRACGRGLDVLAADVEERSLQPIA